MVSLGVIALDLVQVKKGWPKFTRDYRTYVFCALAVVVALLALIPYLRGAEKFGPMVTYAQARQMSEFAPGGRVPFFYPDLWNYWMHGAGGLHIQSRPSSLFAAFLWPIFAFFPRAFPLLGRAHAAKSCSGSRPRHSYFLQSLMRSCFASIFQAVTRNIPAAFC